MRVTIKEFVQISIQELRSGIEDFNIGSTNFKAFMPETMSFSLNVDNCGMVTDDGINKISFEVNILNYPTEKSRE